MRTRIVKRKNTPLSSVTDYRADDFITLTDAVTLLADRDRRRHDTDRIRKGRMRQHIYYATYNGVLQSVIHRSVKCYVFGKIAAWARSKWPGLYDHFPATTDPVRGGHVGDATGSDARSSCTSRTNIPAAMPTRTGSSNETRSGARAAVNGSPPGCRSAASICGSVASSLRDQQAERSATETTKVKN